MRYRSITSILPLLKLQTGKPDLDQLKPELVQMATMVERELGLTEKALHKKVANNLPVVKSVVELPVGFFEERDVLDMCVPPQLRDLTCCSCNCVPCHCGYWFWQYQSGDFTWEDTVLRCPFPEGSVSFTYWGLHLDADGMPMVLEGHVPAFMDYVTAIIKRGEMNAGLISPQLFTINQKMWENQSLFTRSRDNVIHSKQINIMDYRIRNKFRFISQANQL